MTAVQNMMLATIKVARKVFANTPVNNWRPAGAVKGWLFRLGYGKTDRVIQFQGLSIMAPSRDVSVTPGLVGGYYEAAEVEIFKRLAAVSQCIVDVGGNIGLYAALGAKNLPPEGRVITFEPIAENLDYLQRNLSLNQLAEKVAIEPVAVGKEPGELTIHLSRHNVGNHSAAKGNVSDSVESTQVPRVSLDTYFADDARRDSSIDILKIDVEGYDGFVLEGAQEIIGRWKPTLFVEFIPKLMWNCGYDPSRCIGMLFQSYPTCYVIDEISDVVIEVKQDSIADFIKRISNANLIFVSDLAHKALIEAHLSDTSTRRGHKQTVQTHAEKERRL